MIPSELKNDIFAKKQGEGHFTCEHVNRMYFLYKMILVLHVFVLLHYFKTVNILIVKQCLFQYLLVIENKNDGWYKIFTSYN